MSEKGLQKAKKPTFTMALESGGYQKLISKAINDPSRAARFMASISSAVSTTPALQECDPKTVLSAALLGEGLNLTPSPQLGQFYMVPFNDKKNPYGKVAVFIIGYKGYIQLAIRSGYYKKINVLAIKEGELKDFDPMTEEIAVSLIEDDDEREAAETVGYYAMFEYMNGFKKAIYWSKPKMLNHADKYSPAFKKSAYKLLLEGKIPKDELWKYSSYWYADFDGMAMKTMIRQLISKWGVMSVEMQQALEADDRIVQGENVYVEPVEAQETDQQKEPEEPKKDSKGKKAGSLDEL